MITESRAGNDALGVVVGPGTVAYVTTGGKLSCAVAPSFALAVAPYLVTIGCGYLDCAYWQGRFLMAPTPSCRWRTPNRSPRQQMDRRGLGFWRGPPRGRTYAMWQVSLHHYLLIYLVFALPFLCLMECMTYEVKFVDEQHYCRFGCI